MIYLLLLCFGIVLFCSLTSGYVEYTRSFASGSGAGLSNVGGFNWVELNFQVSGTSFNRPGYCGVYNITSDPSSQSDTNLWADMRDGASFNTTNQFFCGITANKYGNLTGVGVQEMYSKYLRGENMSVGIALVVEQHWAALSSPYFIIGYNTSNKAPKLNFTIPTPLNATISNVPYFDINVSIIDESLDQFIFHIESRPYDYGMMSSIITATLYNFENLSVLSETNALVNDVSPDTENNDMILYNNPTFTSTGCMYGKCLYLDGVNQYGIPASPNPGWWHDAFSSVSYAFLIKPDNPTDANAGQSIFEEGGSASGSQAYLNNSQLYWCLQNSNDLDIVNATFPNDGKGHFIYLNWNGTAQEIYIDGNVRTSQVTSFTSIGSHGSDPAIGWSDGAQGCDKAIGYYTGTIDEFWRNSANRHFIYINVTSKAVMNKVNGSYWNFYISNLTGYGNYSNDWKNFQNDTWYYHYSNATDTAGLYNKTELRQWRWTITSVISDSWEVAIIFGFCGIAFCLFGLGRIFKKENWMIKMGLYTFAMITSLVVVSAAQSFSESSLTSLMMSTGLLITIISLSVIFLYLLVITFIGISKNLAQKKDEIWPT